MKRLDPELVNSTIFVLILVAILGCIASYIAFRGPINRWYASISQDRVAQEDLVYQANGVRVYRFVDEGNTCYLADDPQGGAGVYCMK